MVRHVFFSFHYQRDIFRVNQIRNIHNVIGESAAGFRDRSLWERARTQGERAVKNLIDEGLIGTSVTVVCIGAQTANRRYVRYEISRSIDRGNGLLGVRIHHLHDQNNSIDYVGDVPDRLKSLNVPIYRYSSSVELANWIERAARDAGR